MLFVVNTIKKVNNEGMKMKNVNTKIENTQQMETESAGSLAWNDVVVYNEMADQTSVRMNLLTQIQGQMKQLQEMSDRRQFLTREIMNYFSK
ncbi:MAG: hypothetical protein A2622_10145 [Bdellovibrionales bacterium RIFCSPHIGHO2_01_FULL_40_29]|nr:MAG: hypothetical protein A2622_10145 [Bdellovibrionales bacterium RIFCSPHIGHO2_01_FULL_40_29]OFZ32393.1 MAG: hypothetical protein A3D17_12515 [Bdellovibrionales bacterium RIFCSPHIGHO2_02_FULL_40_15]